MKTISVEIGKKVPSFSLPSTGGKTFNLESLKGKKIVLYFYPKDSTPGCTIEGKDFSELNENFKKLNTDIFGVSRDSIKSHENFKSKQKYKMDLLSDSDEKACVLFQVIKEKKMYGKTSKGIERSTFLIDEKGTLIKDWRGVKVPGHAKEVLNFVHNWNKKENSKKNQNDLLL